MSKKRAIWGVRWPLSAALGWWERTASRYWRLVATAIDGDQENQSEVSRTANNSRPLRLDFASERVEIKEFAKALNIGDRIRVFCNDGVVVAEKVSHTQFKVLYSETMSEQVH